MDSQTVRETTVRFASFQLNLKTGELRQDGVAIRLQPQPTLILTLLASRPGGLVTREEIQQRIWGTETFVDFDTGLNSAIRQIRHALKDDTGTPRFIETVPRRGYRFLAPLEKAGNIGSGPTTQPFAGLDRSNTDEHGLARSLESTVLPQAQQLETTPRAVKARLAVAILSLLAPAVQPRPWWRAKWVLAGGGSALAALLVVALWFTLFRGRSEAIDSVAV